MKKFLKVFSYCAGFTALPLAINFIAAVPVVVFFMVLYSLPGILVGNPDPFMSIDLNRVMQSSIMPSLILSGILTFFSAWAIHAIFKRKFLERLSFNKTQPAFIAAGFLAGCALQMPTGFIVSLIESAGVAPDLFEKYSENIETLMDNQNIILQILAVGIAAPLIEEIIFRGLIFNQLKKNTTISVALVIQALLFGIAHLNVVQGSYAFVLGIILGLVALWSDSLLLPIAVHVGMNLSGVFLSEFESGISDIAGLVMLIISFLLAPACMLFIHRRIKEVGDLT